ncbi:MAG: DNA repair protein RadC [Alphaproteobacteria bacterium]|nr:DNA repair protein RadC [Alphaproteobacteria bacterium]
MTETNTTPTVPDYIGHRSRMKNKVLDKGGTSLTEIELLEVLLMYSIPRKDVKPIAKQLLRKFVTLRNVLNADPGLLADVKGVKETTICLFKTVEAACLQMLAPKIQKETYLDDWDSILDFIRLNLSHKDKECLMVIYLNRKKKVITTSISDTTARANIQIIPSDIVSKCVSAKAAAIILIHNHPSGRPTPSDSDIKNTLFLTDQLATLEIELIDHLIVGNNTVYSIKNRGIVK